MEIKVCSPFPGPPKCAADLLALIHWQVLLCAEAGGLPRTKAVAIFEELGKYIPPFGAALNKAINDICHLYEWLDENYQSICGTKRESELPVNSRINFMATADIPTCERCPAKSQMRFRFTRKPNTPPEEATPKSLALCRSCALKAGLISLENYLYWEEKMPN
jgi:hypothetical protein